MMIRGGPHSNLGYVGCCCGAYVFSEQEFIKYLTGIGYYISKDGAHLPIDDPGSFHYVVVPFGDGWFIHIKELINPECALDEVGCQHANRLDLYQKPTEAPIMQLYINNLGWDAEVPRLVKEREGKVVVAIYTPEMHYNAERFYNFDKVFGGKKILYESPDWVWNHNYTNTDKYDEEDDPRDPDTPRLKTILVQF